MAEFTTRVQLNGNPTEQDYQQLHAAMCRGGFKRCVQGSDSKWYRLPHAEYRCSTSNKLSQVRDQAGQIASSVWKDSEVLVTEGPWAAARLKEASRAQLAADRSCTAA